MANYIISDFAKWQKLNEAEFPGRTKQTAGFGQKIVGIPVDETSFKIKIINDLDVIDAAGKLTAGGWTSLLTWIKAQPKWLPYYPGLNDLTKNFVIYAVNKDNDRKQLITFTVMSRTSAPGLPATVQTVKQEELTALIKDASAANILADASKKAEDKKVDTTVPAAADTKTEQTAGYTITKPVPFENLKTLGSDQALFKVVKDLFISLRAVPEIAKLPFFPKVKAEIKAGKIGDSSITLLKGLAAGFKLEDDLGDPLEEVNQDLLNKIAMFTKKSATPAPTAKNERAYYLGLDGRSIFEQTTSVLSPTPAPAPTPAANSPKSVDVATTSLPTGFNLADFIKVVGDVVAEAPTLTTGDIKLPKEGIVRGVVAKKDPELIKAQQLLLDKLGLVLSDDPTYTKFKKYGADGDFGPTTEKIVAMAKAGFELKDTDGSVITAELINKLLTDKITESYLKLDGSLFEKFNVDAAKSKSKAYIPKAKTAKVIDPGMPIVGRNAAGDSKTDDAAKTEDAAKTAIDENATYTEFDSALERMSKSVVTLFTDGADENKEFFDEYRGTINDEDEKAAGAFKTHYDATIKPEIDKLKEKAEKLKALNPEKYAKMILNLGKFTLGMTAIVNKMESNLDSNDNVSWRYYTVVDNKLKTFTVDTDF